MEFGGLIGDPNMSKGLTWSSVCNKEERLATKVWRPQLPGIEYAAVTGEVTLPCPNGHILVCSARDELHKYSKMLTAQMV